MIRSPLKRRKGFNPRYSRHVRPKRVAAVRFLTPFVCPDCGCEKTVPQSSVVTVYGKPRKTWDNVCLGCSRHVRITAFEPRTADSVLEFERSEDRRLAQAAGEISDYREQVEVELPYLNKNGKWRADSGYIGESQLHHGMFPRPRVMIYESVEGVSDTSHKILVRLWRDHGPGILRIVTRGKNRKWIEKDIQGGKATI